MLALQFSESNVGVKCWLMGSANVGSWGQNVGSWGQVYFLDTDLEM